MIVNVVFKDETVDRWNCVVSIKEIYRQQCGRMVVLESHQGGLVEDVEYYASDIARLEVVV